MNDHLPIKPKETVEFTVPALLNTRPELSRPELRLKMSAVKDGECRIVDAMVPNMAMYAELETVYTSAENEARTLMTQVSFEITKSKKVFNLIKSELTLDEWKDYRKENGLNDTAANREAFFYTNEQYISAQDRIDMLEAVEQYFTHKVKIFQEVKRHMRKEIDIRLRGGASNKYLT